MVFAFQVEFSFGFTRTRVSKNSQFTGVTTPKNEAISLYDTLEKKLAKEESIQDMANFFVCQGQQQRIQLETHKETCNLSRQKGSELKPLKQTMKEVINFYETGCSSFHDDVVTLTYRIRISFSPFQTESMTLSMSLRLMYKSNKSAT